MADEETKSRQQKQAESEIDPLVWDTMRLRIATGAAGLGLWSWNVDTGALTMDERSRRLWGVESRPVTFDDLSARIFPDDLDKVREIFTATRDILGAYEVDFRILHGNDIRWVTARGMGHDEGIVGRIMFGVFLDMTERKLGEEETRFATEAKTQFLAAMSHEIRSPLNGIIGYTEQLMDANLPPIQHRLAGLIQTAGSMLLVIVDDILDFSQIEAGRLNLEARSFSLEALIDSAVSIISGSAEEKGLALRYELDPNLPTLLMGDEARLRQVILNLLTNAVKFTHAGHIDLAVESVGQSADGATIRIRVSDTGIGIPADGLHRLFKRFSQVDRSIRREFGGSGLGLAISKSLVELMGGEIGVDSTQGEGSTFWFRVTLPVATTADNAAEEKTILEHAASARILVAEDMQMNQEIVRAILEKAGHRVDIVADGAMAVAAFEETPYDLVLMDIQMPVMDGTTATEAIRALKTPRGHIPIIAMTANVLPQQIRSFKHAGLDDYIAKPMKRADLLEKVNEWLLKPPTGDGC